MDAKRSADLDEKMKTQFERNAHRVAIMKKAQEDLRLKHAQAKLDATKAESILKEKVKTVNRQEALFPAKAKGKAKAATAAAAKAATPSQEAPGGGRWFGG